MFGSNTIEVAIGLVFLFFILSLIVTAAREILEGWLQTRAVHLERGVRELLKDEDGTGLTKDIYNHPLINSLFRGTYDPTQLRPPGRVMGLLHRLGLTRDPWLRYPSGSHLPAYIPARNFALALLDLSARGTPQDGETGTAAITFQQVRAGAAEHITDPALRRAVLVALDGAKGDLEQARANLEAWFDSGMDRVSGWYRKNTQWILFWMGLIAAVALNIDTIRVTQALYENEGARALIVAEAEATVERARTAGTIDSGDTAAMRESLGCTPDLEREAREQNESCAQRRLARLGYPIGWRSGDGVEADNLRWSSLPGWLLTALAITLGAPFWFDLLNKIMVIRSTVKPHEKSPEEASEDRQLRPAAGPTPVPTPTPAPTATPPPADAGGDPDFQPHQWSAGDGQEGDL